MEDTVEVAGTRRIAVIGDSVTRGQGAPFGESFEALLEKRLNDARSPPSKSAD